MAFRDHLHIDKKIIRKENLQWNYPDDIGFNVREKENTFDKVKRILRMVLQQSKISNSE